MRPLSSPLGVLQACSSHNQYVLIKLGLARPLSCMTDRSDRQTALDTLPGPRNGHGPGIWASAVDLLDQTVPLAACPTHLVRMPKYKPDL